MSLPCFALQDKAVSRHFKSCVSAAEAAAANKEGAITVRSFVLSFVDIKPYICTRRFSQKLIHKFNRLQTLVICKGVMMAHVVPPILVRLIAFHLSALFLSVSYEAYHLMWLFV